MKNIKLPIIIAAIMLLAAASFYYSTSYSESKSGMFLGTAMEQVYVCPMHPEVTSDKPGKCPKCGMDLVLKTDNSTDTSKSMNMDMKGCMDKCKDMGCDMSKCGGESGSCKEGCCADGGCKMMKDKDGMKMDDKDGKGMKDKDCKSKCMGK